MLVIADEGARPDVIAADLLAQCEHDPNAKAILLTTSEALATRTIEAVEEELKTLETAGDRRKVMAGLRRGDRAFGFV